MPGIPDLHTEHLMANRVEVVTFARRIAGGHWHNGGKIG